MTVTDRNDQAGAAARLSAADYAFVTRWWLPGARVPEVRAVLADAEALPRWWPSVYLEVRRKGEVTRLYTKGWLPYTLRWSFRVTREHEYGFALRAWGDLVGVGEWTLIPRVDGTQAIYHWRVRAEHPLLRRLSWLFKPVFAANHAWAMRMGERSLRLELAHLRGEQAAPPPGPTFAWAVRAGVLD